MKKNAPYKKYAQDGAEFSLSYDTPKQLAATDTPVRARVNVRLAPGQPYLRKCDLDPAAGKTPLDRTLYGKTAKEIYNEKLPACAAALLGELRACGVLAAPVQPTPGNDLGTLIHTHMDDVLAVYCAHVSETTRTAYRAQLARLAKLCTGVDPERLQGPMLVRLQETIRRAAAAGSRGSRAWQPGDSDPSAARKQFYLLHLMLDHLKSLGLDIPADALQRPGSQTSPRDLALQRTDSARSYPKESLRKLLEHAAGRVAPEKEALLLAVQADTGLRIAEVCGLLWCDFTVLQGSQGALYLLRVSGQLNTGDRPGVRIDAPKTCNGYRHVPLSVSLGQALERRRRRLAHSGVRLDLLPVFLDGPTAGRQVTETECRQLLERYRTFAAEEMRTVLFPVLQKARACTFDAAAQDRQLRDMLTPHSLRRNYVTALYTRSMESQGEISRAVGHAQQQKLRGTKTGAGAADEQYLTCLRHAAAGIGVDSPLALRYDVARHNHTEVACLRLELRLPPHSQGRVIVCETQPGTAVRLCGDAGVQTEREAAFPQPQPPQPERLLADWENWAIKEKSRPLQKQSWRDILSGI